MPDLRHLLDEHEFALTEGAVIERLKRTEAVRLDPFVANATLVGDSKSRFVMEHLYREYLDIGRDADRPMLLFTPTWRASAERAARAGLELDVNRAAYEMLKGIRDKYGGYGSKVAIGGLVGPRADAYRPSTALPPDAARQYHQPQVETLAFAGVDFIIAATLPALSEARGIALAAAEYGVPYLFSFVLRPDGALLDGTVLAAAIRSLDSVGHQRPFGYLINCVHPDTFRIAAELLRVVPEVRARLIGLQANASRQRPAALDGAAATDHGDPDEFGRLMAELQRDFRLKILGGCCGTDGRHIRAIADALVR